MIGNCKTYDMPPCLFCRNADDRFLCDIPYSYGRIEKNILSHLQKNNILNHLIKQSKSDIFIYFAKAIELYYPDLTDQVNKIKLLS